MDPDPGSLPTQPTRSKSSKLGGLKITERLLGLRHEDGLPTDAVFVSLDLETDADRNNLEHSAEKPVVKQLAYAKLDTRDVRSLAAWSDLRSLISVQMVQTKLPKKGKKSARQKERERCVFAQTQLITPEKVSRAVYRSLRIKDTLASPGGGQLRNIVLVGHSIKGDLKVLRFLGIEIFDIAPILAIVDTHIMSRFILPPYRPDVTAEPGQDFSLAGVLAELGCLPNRAEFHNAGNDAVYSLYAMLLLAVKEGEGTARRAELGPDELRNLDTIRRAVFRALERSMPHGFVRPAAARTFVTLGSGLRELAWMLEVPGDGSPALNSDDLDIFGGD